MKRLSSILHGIFIGLLMCCLLCIGVFALKSSRYDVVTVPLPTIEQRVEQDDVHFFDSVNVKVTEDFEVTVMYIVPQHKVTNTLDIYYDADSKDAFSYDVFVFAASLGILFLIFSRITKIDSK